MKKGILLAAYGASSHEGRLELGSFERRCRKRFPEIPLRWAFTSPFQRDRLAMQNRKSDSVGKALMRFHFEQFEQIAIQPLQIIPGYEHNSMLQAIREIEKKTKIKCFIGRPLISGNDNIPLVAEGLIDYARKLAEADANAVFMAHGAKHAAGRLYEALAQELSRHQAGVFLAAMISAPTLEDVLPYLTTEKIWLLPMLSVTGLHALRDMAGDDPQSWVSRINRHGHQCVPVLHGLIESEFFANCWISNLAEIIIQMDAR